MKATRIALYVVIALIAVLLGLHYLDSDVPPNWYWPTNLFQLLTRQ